MPFYDPVAARFAVVALPPWQLSRKNFDFEAGFVKWIQKYLEMRKLVCDVVSAKAWINKSKFDGERYELCELQWEAYQESLASKPVLKAAVADPIQFRGDGGDSDQSAADRVADVMPPQDLPDEFARLEGESSAEYSARMMRIARSKISKIGSW